MIYYPDSMIDNLLLDDINQGDLTTRILGIGQQDGEISFTLKDGGRSSGIDVVEKIFAKLNISLLKRAADGADIEAGGLLISGRGRAESLHMAWKVSQNILEWSCGVASYTSAMVKAAQAVNPSIQTATTRKNIPGTKLLALSAVINGGGIIHRGGTAETILLFANHRRFFPEPDNWEKQIALLRTEAPEKKVIAEADEMDEAKKALAAKPDVLQLDKFTPEDVAEVVKLAADLAPECTISAAGGVNKDNSAIYAKAGAKLLVSSAPYYAKPSDVKVILKPV